MKETILGIIGAAGAAIAGIFGGWSSGLTTLLIFMLLDYVTGLLVAGVFHKSPKSENGALESLAGFKGLVRKGMVLLVILIGCRLDLLLGVDYVRDGLVIAFVVNECLSIIENAGLMGVPIPKVLTNAIEVLREREEITNDK